MKAALALSLVLLAPSLAGCTGPSRLEEDNQSLDLHYYVVFHPLDLEWDAETGTLVGRFYASYIEPNYPRSDDYEDVALRGMSAHVKYYDDGGPGIADNMLGRWSIGYDSELPMNEGDTYAFNFTTTLPASQDPDDIVWITLSVDYDYGSVVILDDGTRAVMGVVPVRYSNWCLRVDGGHLRQYTDGDRCHPNSVGSRYKMSAAFADLPPVDYWNEWSNIDEYPPLLRVRDFLNSYEYNDVKYYSGTVRCSLCEGGTWSS